MHRRALITGIASLLVAPAIVRATSLMPIKGDIYRFWTATAPLLPPIEALGPDGKLDWGPYLGPTGRFSRGVWTFYGKHRNSYLDEQVAFRKEEYDLPPHPEYRAAA